MAEGYIVLGAYRKVFDLEVHEGEVVHFRDHPGGWDSRWNKGGAERPVPMDGGSLFGCSLAAPVEAFLKINGWDEDCDSKSTEDYTAGIMLQHAGYDLRYDRRMLSLESEEAHDEDPPYPRIIKHRNSDA